MTIFCKKNKLVFLKNWRVSGTTFQYLISSYLDKSAIISSPSIKLNSTDTQFLEKLKNNEIERRGFVSKNFLIDILRKVLLKKRLFIPYIVSYEYFPKHYGFSDFQKDFKWNWNSYHTVSLVRNPFDQLVSSFIYRAKHNRNLLNKKNFYNFLKNYNNSGFSGKLQVIHKKHIYSTGSYYNYSWKNFYGYKNNKFLIKNIFRFEDKSDIYHYVENFFSLKKNTIFKRFANNIHMKSYIKVSDIFKKRLFLNQSIALIEEEYYEYIKHFNYKIPIWLK